MGRCRDGMKRAQSRDSDDYEDWMERVGAVRDQNDLTLMLYLSHCPDNTFVFWTNLKLSCANRLYFYSFCP